MTPARLRPPEAVLEIADRLERAGYETWCVGGAVRDALLGIPHLDWDLATAAHPSEVQRLFKRTVPHGIRFGTIGVLDGGGHMHEVTTFRKDVETDGRHAVVEFGASLDDDLARRDFTINAIAYSPSRGLHDPFGGEKDLERRIVRAVGDARSRMREDRLRALRAIRFASRFGFEIDDPTWAAIEESAPHLSRLSPERVQQEIEKTMEQVPQPGQAFRRWRDSGAFRSLVPALGTISDLSLDTLDRLPLPSGPKRAQRLSLRLAALFVELPPKAVDGTLRALRFSNDRIRWIAALLRAQGPMDELRALLTSGAWERSSEPAPRSAAAAPLRRIVAAAGRLEVLPALRLAAARWDASTATNEQGPEPSAVRRAYRATARIVFGGIPLSVADLAVDGEDLMAAGVPEGKKIRQIQEQLLDAVLRDPSMNTRDALLALVRSLLADSSQPARRNPT